MTQTMTTSVHSKKSNGVDSVIPDWTPELGAEFMKAWNHDKRMMEQHRKPFRDNSSLTPRAGGAVTCIILVLAADANITDYVIGLPIKTMIPVLVFMVPIAIVLFMVLIRYLLRNINITAYGDWFYGRLATRAKLGITREYANTCLTAPYRYKQWADHPLTHLNGMFFNLLPQWMVIDSIGDWLNPYLVLAEHTGHIDGRIVMTMDALVSISSVRPSDEDVRLMRESFNDIGVMIRRTPESSDSAESVRSKLERMMSHSY